MFMLAPSTRLEENAYLKVASVLFEDGIEYVGLIRSLVFSSPYISTSPTPSTSQEIPELTKMMKMLNELYSFYMPGLKVKEACGTPLLGDFSVCLAKVLTTLHEHNTYTAEMEFTLIKEKLKSGAKPSCDAAIAVTTAVVNKTTPVLLFEYKPAVDTRETFVDHHSLMETLIQGYYCLYQHQVHSIIHCLTDMFQWYYFKLEREKFSKMKVAWYHSIFEKELNLQTHVNFLHPLM